VTYAGAFERLRLRLPPIAGVRPIAPAVPYGSGFVLVEATRAPELAQRFPLAPGDRAWVGVQRIHALAHPGMSFLLLTDGTAASAPAIDVGGQIARLAHARTTILSVGGEDARPATGATVHTSRSGRGRTRTNADGWLSVRGHPQPSASGYPDREQLPTGAEPAPLQEAREQIGSGLPSLETRAARGTPAEAVRREVERQPYDLVVIGSRAAHDGELAEELLSVGEHHLLLAPAPRASFARALICVAAGEPGKDDVLFAGRLLRHIGAEATLLTVLTAERDGPERRQNAERFLAAGVRTLDLLGVPARTIVRSGPVREQIVAEMTARCYDLLVLGAPLARGDGRRVLAGVVGQILGAAADQPVLIVRSAYVSVPTRLPFAHSTISIST
jgi:sulfate transport system ATP-binding protein